MYCIEYEKEKTPYRMDLTSARKDAAEMIDKNDLHEPVRITTNKGTDAGAVGRVKFGKYDYRYVDKGIVYPMDSNGNVYPEFSVDSNSDFVSSNVALFDSMIPMPSDDLARLYSVKVLKAHPEYEHLHLYDNDRPYGYLGSTVCLKRICPKSKVSMVFVSDNVTYEIRPNGSLKLMPMALYESIFGVGMELAYCGPEEPN